MNDSAQLLANLSKIRTTKLGKERIKKNLCLEADNAVDWVIEKIQSAAADIALIGKNWYVGVDNIQITINAGSFTIIAAHKNGAKTKRQKFIKPS
jgi:hypothetical protein